MATRTLTLRTYYPGGTTPVDGIWSVRFVSSQGAAIDPATATALIGTKPVRTSSGVATVALKDSADLDPPDVYYQLKFISHDEKVKLNTEPFLLDATKTDLTDLFTPTMLPVTPSVLVQAVAARDDALAAAAVAESHMLDAEDSAVAADTSADASAGSATAAAGSATAAAGSATAAAGSATTAANNANGFTGGTATALAPGATPTVSITGTAPARQINLGIPAGLADDTSMAAVAADDASAFRGELNTAIDGVAKFKVSDSGLFVSTSGDDANDGLSFGAAKATIAAAHAALPGGKGIITAGAGNHTVNAIVPTSGLTLQGIGRATQLVSTGTMFAFTGSGNVYDLLFRDFAAFPGAEFMKGSTGKGLALSKVADLYINPTGDGSVPAIDMAFMIDTEWRFHLETATTKNYTVPLVRLLAVTNNVDAIANNVFSGRVTHNSSYPFHIEDATGGSYAENNKIRDMNFEIPNKGVAKILSGTGNVLDNCYGVDFTATVTVPLIYVGKSAASTRISQNNRINFHRHGGTLGSGGYDVQAASFSDARNTLLLDCWADSGGFKVDWGGSTGVSINTPLSGFTNSAVVTAFSPLGGVKFPRDNVANWVAASSAGAGAAWWDTVASRNKLIVSDGTNWVEMAVVNTATATLDFPSIAAGSAQSLTIAVTGAVVGNAVALAPPAAVPAGLVWNGYVSAADTVTVRLTNITGSAIDPAAAVWRATVVR